MKIDKLKLKKKLENKLGRQAKFNERINAEKDVGLLVELLFDELENLKGRISKLEKI